jgi:DNA-binding transcriptional LysR family regulator
VRVEGQFTFNATAQMLNAALAGAGLAYVPESMVQHHLAKSRLKRVLEGWCVPYSGYHLFYPSRRQFEWAKRSAIPLMNSLACVSFMTSFDEFSIPPAP